MVSLITFMLSTNDTLTSSKLICSTPPSQFSQCVPRENPSIDGVVNKQMVYYPVGKIQQTVFPSDTRCPISQLNCDLTINDKVFAKVSMFNIAHIPNKASVSWALTAVKITGTPKNVVSFVNLYGHVSYSSYSLYYQNAFVTIITPAATPRLNSCLFNTRKLGSCTN